MIYKSVLLLLVILNAFNAMSQGAEPLKLNTQAVSIEPSMMAFPSRVGKREKCGILFVLPYTGGVSSQFMRVYFNDWSPQMNVKLGYEIFMKKLAIDLKLILVMVSGNTSKRDHDTKGFADAITRFDAQIKKDLTLLEEQYPIDKSKLYLTGFSLGGDLSWAISQKNPGMFKGAVIAGSRCGYRSNGGFTAMKKSNFKVYIGMGQHEIPVIRQGIELAKTDLLANEIDHMYYEIPNVAHKMIPEDKFLEALRFVLGQ